MIATTRRLIVVCLCALLAGCATSTTSPTLPTLTFEHQPPIRLAVGKIDMVNQYKMPLAPPNVEHEFPVAPGPAAERWAGDVLRAVGGAGSATLVILNGAVTEARLKKKTGLRGTFTVDQSERYDAVVEARLVIVDGAGTRRGQISAIVKRSSTVAENISLNDRARAQYDLIETLMTDFDAAMRTRADQHLREWLR